MGNFNRIRRSAVALVAVTVAVAAAFAAAPVASAQSSGAPKPSGDPVKVAVFVDQSGALAPSGQAQLAGIQTWYETLGKSEGILGRPVQLIIKDNGGTAASAGAAAREILDQKPDLIIGPSSSALGGAVLPLFTDAKVFNLNMSSLTASSDPTLYPFTFNMYWMKTTEAEAQYDYLCKLGVKKVGIISPNGAVGDAQVTAANGKLGSAPCAKNLKIVGTQRFDVGAADLTTQAQNLQQAGAEALLVGAFTSPDFASLYRALKDLGWKPWALSNIATTFPAAVTTADPAEVPKIVGFGCFKNGTTPLTKDAKEYQKAFAKAGQQSTSQPTSMYGYAAGQALQAAAKGAGSLEPSAMQAWLEKNPVASLVYDYQFSANLHNGATADQVLGCSAGANDANGYYKASPTAEVAKKKYGNT